MHAYRTPPPPFPLPRSVVARPDAGQGCALWFVRLFILPHTLVGVALALSTLFQALLPVLGQTATAHVVSTDVSHSKNSYSYAIRYAYPYEGREFQDATSISLGSRPQPTPAEERAIGHTFEVRHLGLGHLRTSRPTNSGSPWGMLLAMIPFLVFWNGIVGVFWYLLWYVPWRDRRLYEHGEATVGRLVRKLPLNRRGVGSVEVEFSAQGSLHRATSSVIAARWSSLVEGQPLTVLHPSGRATPNVVYELGPYRWQNDPG